MTIPTRGSRVTRLSTNRARSHRSSASMCLSSVSTAKFEINFIGYARNSDVIKQLHTRGSAHASTGGQF